MRVQRRSAVQQALRALFAWIGRYVRGFYAALGLALTLALGAVLGAVAGFTELAEWVEEGKTQSWDERILRGVHGYATPTLDMAANEITSLGATLVVAMVMLVASVLLWISRHRYSVLLLWVAVGGASVLNWILKAHFARPRPQVFPWRTEYATAASFPSGHSMTAMAAYATLAYLVARLSPTRALRRLTVAVAGVVIGLIGLSRVYLGVHYPSDVLAGFLSGFAWAGFSALGIEALRHFRGRKPGVEEVEEDLDAWSGDVPPTEEGRAPAP